jgi:glyoxylase-like metal-dependent hydrolase (beta-lactamase superfamily II)
LSDQPRPGGDPKLEPASMRLTVDKEPLEIVPGLFGLRFALPFALDHVNLWLLADGEGWSLIDAGLSSSRTRERWQALLATPFFERPIGRLIATHFHPDHMGLASWLSEKTDAELWASRTEWLMGRMLAQDTSASFVEAGRLADRLAGLSEAQIAERAARGNLYRTRADPPPASYRRLRQDDRLVIDGTEWRMLVGRGHAPEMLCLYSAERNLLIAADQVLPRISPNVSVWPAEPEAEPLSGFMGSLAELRALPDDCLVLPSHGQPFFGLHERIDELIGHHEERLAKTLEACARPATVVEVIPALFDRELDSHQLGFALGEALAHLNHLVGQGRLLRRLDDDGRLRFSRN